MLHSAASHLGLHCLLRPVCPKTINKITHFRLNKLPYHYILEKSNLNFRHFRLCDLDIPGKKWLHFANSGESDQMLHSAASDLHPHCLPVALLLVTRLNGINSAKYLKYTFELGHRISYKITYVRSAKTEQAAHPVFAVCLNGVGFSATDRIPPKTDQIVWMYRLIWVFAGRICSLVRNLCPGSFSNNLYCEQNDQNI